MSIFTKLISRSQQTELPDLDLEKLLPPKNMYSVLVIYPHPDDETMFSAGLIRMLVVHPKFNVDAVSVTKGEYGDELLKLPPQELGEVRIAEFNLAMDRLGVENRHVWDWGDGGLRNCKRDLLDKLKELQLKKNYDVIVTYEYNGVYGHPDHVVLAELVEELAKLPNKPLILRATLPDKLFKKLNLPKEILGEKLNIKRITEPEYKLDVFRYNFARYRAIKAYKSQDLGKNGSPLVYCLTMNYEYYTTKYEQPHE